jgi:hypothetical protein
MIPLARRSVVLIATVVVFATSVTAFDRGNWKTCKDSGFCQRQRSVGPRESTFSVDATTVSVSAKGVTATLKDASGGLFSMVLTVFPDRTAALLIDEVSSTRYRVADIIPDGTFENSEAPDVVLKSDARLEATFAGGAVELLVQYTPLRIDFVVDGKPSVSFNARGQLHIETGRVPEGMVSDGSGEETWKGAKDTKPKGPQVQPLFTVDVGTCLPLLDTPIPS